MIAKHSPETRPECVHAGCLLVLLVVPYSTGGVDKKLAASDEEATEDQKEDEVDEDLQANGRANFKLVEWQSSLIRICHARSQDLNAEVNPEGEERKQDEKEAQWDSDDRKILFDKVRCDFELCRNDFDLLVEDKNQSQ